MRRESSRCLRKWHCTSTKPSALPISTSKEQGAFTETSSNNERARSRKELSGVILAKMTSWEEQSSEQDNKQLERNEPEEGVNKPDGTQALKIRKEAEGESDLRNRGGDAT